MRRETKATLSFLALEQGVDSPELREKRSAAGELGALTESLFFKLGEYTALLTGVVPCFRKERSEVRPIWVKIPALSRLSVVTSPRIAEM